MRTHAIPSITKPVSTIGLGTMIFHPDTKERDFELLDTFVENGGTFIDTAEVYGAVEERGFSEIVIGDWLSRRPGAREKIVLNTKGLIPGYCAPLHPGGAQISPQMIHKAIDGSLQRLQTDYLDFWMFHRDDLSQAVGPLVDALDEEVKAGRLLTYGASNWETTRIQEAIDYARANDKAEMTASSPHFSLASAKEPYWPDTVVTTEKDRQWFSERQLLLDAWSSLGRGFFSRADQNDTSDADLVRVFYSDQNFERKSRAEEFGKAKGLTMFEVALAYVINQDFPVVALAGAESPEEVVSSTRAGDLELTGQERNWLDLTSDVKPF